MKNNVLDVIKNRRTRRLYKQEQVDIKEIMTLLEAGSYAPSGKNMQSWHFTVVQDDNLIQEMNQVSKNLAKNCEFEILRNIGNNPKSNIFYNAPTIIVVSYQENAPTPIEDISAATQNILLQAESMNIGACWNGFVTATIFRNKLETSMEEKLNIPDGYIPHHAISIGYVTENTINVSKRKDDFFNFSK